MLTGKQLNRNIRQIGFVVLLGTMLVMMVSQMSYFIGSVLGAFTLYMLLRRPHDMMVRRGWNRLAASITIVTGAVLAMLGISAGVLSIILPLVKEFDHMIVVDNLRALHDVILQKTGFNIFSEDVIGKLMDTLGGMVPDIFSTTGSVVLNAFMLFVLLYFMLQGNHLMEDALTSWLPLRSDSIALLKHETHSLVLSNAIGIPVVMAGHSVISGLGYWALGVTDPVVWGLITGFCGLLPVIGTAVIWVPLGINLIVGGMVWQGVALLVYGGVVVAGVDNLLRMVIMKSYADVHPLITLLGVIMGINLFGFWGIIFGPLMISAFLLLLKIYRSEYLESDSKTE